jgi:RNA polymerase sigma-70 factor, ECF subfamily
MSGTQSQSQASSGEPTSRAVHDPATFVELYRRNYDAIFRYCVQRLFDRHTAEDVTSEVFLKAAQHARRFDGSDESHFRSWLYRVATNEINSHLRKTSRREKLLRFFGQGPDQEAVASGDDAQAEKLARLKKALLGLKPRYQTVITLRFSENLTHNEIAGVLGHSPGTVRSHLSRAIAELRMRLDAVGEAAGER